MPQPNPRQCPEPDLERAGPVDTALKGIIAPPQIQLPSYLVAIWLISGEYKGLREQDQMLMAIDLPNPLVIAGRGQVEIGDEAEIFARSFRVAQRITPPGGRGAVVDLAIEDGNAAEQHLIGQLDQFADVVGSANRVGHRLRRGQSFQRGLSAKLRTRLRK